MLPEYDPFALPSPSAFAYRLLNLVSFLAIIQAVNFLLSGGQQTLDLMPLFGLVASILCAGAIFFLARRGRGTQPVEAREADHLREQFRPFADGMSFRQTEGEDAYALDLGTPTCVIGRKYVAALTSDDGRGDVAKAKFVVAHELSHLLSRDTKDFYGTLALMSLALGCGLACLVELLQGLLPFTFRTIAGFAYVGLAYLFMVYWAIRVREFYADKIAGLVVGEEVGHQVLTRAARAAKYVNHSFWYFVTHPSPVARLRNYDRFAGVFEYSTPMLLICAFVLSSSLLVVPLAFYSFRDAFNTAFIGLPSLLALPLMGAVAVTALVSVLYINFHLVVPATIVGAESFVGITIKCMALLLCAAANLEIISLLFSGREIISLLVEHSTNPAEMALSLTSPLLLHWVYFFMARQFCRTGAGKISSRLRRRWQWYGGFLAILLLGMISSITGVNQPSSDDVPDWSDNIATVALTTILIGLTYWAWRRALRKNKEHFSKIQSVKAAEADQTALEQRYLVEWVNPTVRFRLAFYAAAYVVGLYFLSECVALLIPIPTFSRPPTNAPEVMQAVQKHLWRDVFCFFLWTFLIFPIIAFILESEGRLFSTTPVITVFPRK